ncbi:hypothetical protein [Sphingomonas pituitosa]|uniref:hypothetical protein n=1 Tax=Sphingomonas pituitosa TaxID=99597 RepID=UPI000B081C00|nr:hypothetical protein [Sphingomonas pituitosa]
MMALSWATLIVGGAVLFGLPPAVFWLNTRRRNAGWWVLLAVIALVFVGNAAEKLTTGNSPLF